MPSSPRSPRHAGNASESYYFAFNHGSRTKNGTSSCRMGFTSRCVEVKLFGSSVLPGAQAQYVRVPRAGGTLFHAPQLKMLDSQSDIPRESLLILSDILPTGYFAAKQAFSHPNLEAFRTPVISVASAAPLTDEDRVITVAVVGLGPVGIVSRSCNSRVPRSSVYCSFIVCHHKPFGYAYFPWAHFQSHCI